MGALLLLLAFLMMGLWMARGCRRRFLQELAALLCLPFTTLVSLIRQCK